ncbi:MAG: 30S ribosomal protein S6 [Deltaproteobacteria bacterium]|nr:30S ribosomal protein S6 [Deltaproteobacteria bacterium]
MKKYELIVVYSTLIGEQGLVDEVVRLKELVTAQGGKDIEVETWGKKEFAYKIGKQRFGFYIHFTFASDNSGLIQEVQRLLSINDKVLRYQSHRADVAERKFKGFLNSIDSSDDSDFSDMRTLN